MIIEAYDGMEYLNAIYLANKRKKIFFDLIISEDRLNYILGIMLFSNALQELQNKQVINRSVCLFQHI